MKAFKSFGWRSPAARIGWQHDWRKRKKAEVRVL